MDTITGHRLPRPQPAPPKRLKAARVLDALNAGLAVTVDGQQLRMTEEHDLVIEADAYRIENNQKVLLPPRLLRYDLTVGDFIRACERLSDEDVFLISAHVALNRS